MKIVLDSNVIIAGLIVKGATFEVVSHTLRRHEVYISPYIVGEIVRALKKKLDAPPDVVEEVKDLLSDLFIHVDPAPPESPIEFQDKKDIPILSLAFAVNADLFVTGGKALLELKRFKSTRIIYPTQLWKLEKA